VSSPLGFYADGLLAGAGRSTLVARLADGTTLPVAMERYTSPADATDEQLLRDLSGPVLDVGCGPGRHLHALARRGVFALGVDLSPVAVQLACGGGGRAIVANIFDELPGAGSWRSALLLDGNIGIGGEPSRLLDRVRTLLSTGGEALVELEQPSATTVNTRARLESSRGSSAWFPWARVAAPDIDQIALVAGLQPQDSWSERGRWFARLVKR
jgi:SAM-dependent methyltransferase